MTTHEHTTMDHGEAKMGQRSVHIRFNGGSLRWPASMIADAKALEHLVEDTDGSHPSVVEIGLHCSQDVLDCVSRLLLTDDGAETIVMTEDQWLGVAGVANLLDCDRLHRAVTKYYMTWFARDRSWLRGRYAGVTDLADKVDMSLARRLFDGVVHSVKDVCELAEQDNVWYITVFGGHYEVNALAVLPDGRLASGSTDGTVRLWDMTTGRCTATLIGDTCERIGALAVLSDGRLAAGHLASGSSTVGSVIIWNTKTRQFTKMHTEYGVYAVCGLPDGSVVAGESMNHELKSNRVPTSDMLETVLASALVLLPDGRIAAAFEASIMLHDFTGEPRHEFMNGHHGFIYCLAVLPDGSLASGSGDFSIKVWNTSTCLCTGTLREHECTVSALAVLADGRLASGDSNGSVYLWNTETMLVAIRIAAHSSRVTSLAVLHDGRLASASRDRNIKVWNPTSGVCETMLEGYTAKYRMSVWDVVVLADGRVGTCDYDGVMNVWNQHTGTLDTTIVFDGRPKAFAVLPDGTLAYSCSDAAIRLLDINTGACNQLTGHTGSVNALLMLCGDKVMASGSMDKTVKLWDVVGRVCTRTFNCGIQVLRLEPLPEARIAVFSYGLEVQVWTTETCEQSHSFKLPTIRRTVMVPALDGDTFDTWKARILEFNDKKRTMYHTPVTQVVVLPGNRLVSVMEDRNIHVDNRQIAGCNDIAMLRACKNGSIVVGCSVPRIMRDVSLLANVFLALTAAGVPLPYVWKVLS